MIDNNSPGNSFPEMTEYFSSWTINGSPVISRNLFRHDQFAVPANPTVTNADLSLYYEAKSFRANNTSLTHPNKSVLHRSNSSWIESSAGVKDLTTI
ncbi:MAG TPA: hypothetical protein VE978_02750 [Chitinophagales bacterium]|nr:hypothetical protein [Chitinophagales bacterium]